MRSTDFTHGSSPFTKKWISTHSPPPPTFQQADCPNRNASALIAFILVSGSVKERSASDCAWSVNACASSEMSSIICNLGCFPVGRVDVMSLRGTRKRILTNENDATGTKKACTSLPALLSSSAHQCQTEADIKDPSEKKHPDEQEIRRRRAYFYCGIHFVCPGCFFRSCVKNVLWQQ